ncbi:MAG: glycosyltransferase family 87 protein [Candidatus Obscuribacterales bacterium]|nr:glycosyltransferase family 87 protein [Candidatus Obscuribacterales bacterium]
MPSSDRNVPAENLDDQKPNLLWKIASIIYLAGFGIWASTLYFLIVRKTFSHEAFMHAVKSLVFIDFSKFYIAGLMAWSPDKSKLYDFPTQMLWVQNILGTLDRPPDSIPYTPMFCVFMRAFTWLPIEKALLFFFITTFSMAVISVTAILVHKGHLKKSECLIFWILALTPVGCTEIFQLGQTTFFWLAMMSAFYLGFLKKHDIVSGIALAFLALKPQYALLATAAPIGCKRWKILAAAAVAELIFVIVATCVVGVDTMIYYPKFLNWAAGHVTTFIPNHNPTLGMITLRGLLAPFLPEVLNYQIGGAINLLVWIPLLLVWRKSAKIGEDAFSWAIVLTVACTVFFSAHSMLYDFMLVTIGWAATLKSGELNGKIASDDNLRRVWVMMFWLLPGLTWLLASLQLGYEASARAHAIILFCIICVGSANLARIFKRF